MAQTGGGGFHCQSLSDVWQNSPLPVIVTLEYCATPGRQVHTPKASTPSEEISQWQRGDKQNIYYQSIYHVLLRVEHLLGETDLMINFKDNESGLCAHKV